jgi:hypothetical protein
MRNRGILVSRLNARTEAVGLSHHRPSLDLTAWLLLGDPDGCRSTSVLTPIWRVARLHAGGAAIPGHDVSGTGWQILGRAMQSITTMMPVWQCGHSRNDFPVSAARRSR